MMRRATDFTTMLANRLAAISSDIRVAEKAEHVGRYDEAEDVMRRAERDLSQLLDTLRSEMEQRLISSEIIAMRFRKSQ